MLFFVETIDREKIKTYFLWVAFEFAESIISTNDEQALCNNWWKKRSFKYYLYGRTDEGKNKAITSRLTYCMKKYWVALEMTQEYN